MGSQAAHERHLEQMRRCRLQEHTMSKLFARVAKDQSGATAIEYGLMASLIAVAIIGAITTVGSKLTTTFGNVSSNLK